MEHIFFFPHPCPWRKICDCTCTDNVSGVPNQRMFGLPAWKVPLFFAPSLKRKQASLHLCFDFLQSVAYWNTICACSMSLVCQQNTHSLNDIFNPLYRILTSIYIDMHTFSFHHWHRNDIFVPNYYCDNVMQSLSRQTPLLPATAQNFAL